MNRIRGFEVHPDYNPEHIIMPTRSTEFSAGYDLYVPKDFESVVLQPYEQLLIHTGLKAYMLPDEFLGVYIRSGLALKKRITLQNGVGIIDADYYHTPYDIGLIILNHSDESFEIQPGDKLAQGIFQKYLLVDEDNSKNKRVGGYGSTGIK